MSPGVLVEEGKQHVTIYTSSSGLKKEGKGEEKIHTSIVGGAQSAHWAYWWKRDECWSEMASFKVERERGKALLL